MPTPRQHVTGADKQRAYRERQKQARQVEQSAKGLPALPSVATMPGTARWRAMVATARLQLETTRDEMESYASDRSDAWQESDQADQHRARLETIENALETLGEIDFG